MLLLPMPLTLPPSRPESPSPRRRFIRDIILLSICYQSDSILIARIIETLADLRPCSVPQLLLLPLFTFKFEVES